MTQDDLVAYCRRVLAQAEADGLSPLDLATLGGYLATCGLNQVAPKHRAKAVRWHIAGIKRVLAVTQPLVDAFHDAEQQPSRFDA